MKKNIVVLFIFLALTVVMTYPLIFKINAYIPGFFSSDENFAPLWDSWRIHYAFQNKLTFKTTDLIAYPFGINLYASQYLSFGWLGVLYFLSIFTTPVLMYNIQVLLCLFLSAVFTYVLVFYLTKNRLAAIFSAIIFSFCPYQFARIWQHLSLVYNQWIVLCLFGVILVKEEHNKRNAILFFVSLLLLLSFDYSIMFLAMVSIGIFVFYILLYNWKTKLFKNRELILKDFVYIRKVVVLIVAAIILLLPQFYPVIKNRIKLSGVTEASVFNPYHRPFDDLFDQSAKPLSYFLPAAVHPIFGKITEQFIGSPLYGISYTEHTLYLGWTPLILAFIAFRTWKKRRKKVLSVKFQVLDKDDNFYIGFFIILALTAWFFSQPPWWKIGPLKIYMPSFFMYKILPMFRAYCRFGIVVMLAVAVLAGYGLKFILERFSRHNGIPQNAGKTQRMKVVVTTIFCGLVLFEFWNYPPFKVIDVSKVPAVYYWLKDQPKDTIIAEYPLDADSPNEMYKFYQTTHEKKIINGTMPGTYANKVAQTIVKLSLPKTTSVLKWMGVTYVLVHRQNYLDTEQIEWIEELDKIKQNPGLKFIKNFPAESCFGNIRCTQETGLIDVYEIIASPIEPDLKKEEAK